MNKFMAFALGAVAGAAGAYVFTKKNLGDKMNGTLNDIREMYRKKLKELKEDAELEDAVEIKDMVKTAEGKIKTEEKDIPIYEKPRYEDEENPYPIRPEEFGESEDYDMVTLRYDGTNLYRAKDGGKTLVPVKNAEKLVGPAFAKWIGMYEPGVAHIRNESTMTDYEILVVEG